MMMSLANMTRLVEDSTLREAFWRGDRDALTEVYREYSSGLFSLITRGFSFESKGQQVLFKGYNQPWDLENAAQEVFLRAFSSSARQSYDGIRPYRNYLYTIAKNLVIDTFRAADRKSISLDQFLEMDREGDLLQFESTQRSPEEQTAEQELQNVVTEFVSGLSDEDRGVFEVRFRDGLSVEMAAKKLGSTEHKIKKGEKLIKKKFFLKMQESGYFSGYRYSRLGLERLTLFLLLTLGPRL